MLKFYLRLYLTPFLIYLGRALGISWTSLGSLLSRFVLIAQLSKLNKTSCPDSTSNGRIKLNVVFLSMLGGFHTNNSIQMLLANALRKRGHNITFILCDKVLPICEMTESHYHHRREEICTQCFMFGKAFFKKSGFKVIHASSLFSTPIPESSSWNKYVESMLLRYFKVGILDKTDPLVNELESSARKAATISEAIGHGLLKLNPDRVVIGHGVYTTRGPAREVINKAGVPLLSISRGKVAQTQKLNWKTSGDWWDVSVEWEKIKDKQLNKFQNAVLNDYLQSRRNHLRDVMVYNHSPEESESSIRNKLAAIKGGTIFTLFTNVLWDATSAQREIVFNNSIEWVVETIRWFQENPEFQLIIRIHPAEKVIGTRQPFIDILNEELPEIPKNVKILAPEIDVNSWSLLKITDVGLVHTSTVGLELAMEGKPCVCVAHTHYRDKGFTYDVQNSGQYFSMIKRLGDQSSFSNITKKLARRYAYLLFFRYQLPLPFFNPKSHIDINSFSNLNFEDICKHPSVRTMIQSIENQDEFLLSDEHVEQLYSV